MEKAQFSITATMTCSYMLTDFICLLILMVMLLLSLVD